MDIGVIAKRYAKALLDFAVEQKCEDTVYDEVLTLIQSYRDVPQVATVLGNPLLPQQQKIQVLCQAVSTTSPSPVYQKFAALVVAHRRESFMLFIAHNFVTLYSYPCGIRPYVHHHQVGNRTGIVDLRILWTEASSYHHRLSYQCDSSDTCVAW